MSVKDKPAVVEVGQLLSTLSLNCYPRSQRTEGYKEADGNHNAGPLLIQTKQKALLDSLLSNLWVTEKNVI